MAEIDIARIETGNITNAADQACVVNINLSIVHGCNRALDLIGLATFAAHLHRVRAIQHTHISVGIRHDMECTVRLHAGPVYRRITTNRHIIAGCSTAAVLRGHILFLILLELTALMALVTVHHGQIACRTIFLVSAEIFAPHIHDPQALRLYILIILEFLQDTGCTPCQCVFTVTEHSRKLVREQVADLTPQLGIAGVKHALGADGIRILVAVTQGQSALVVVALRGIVVVVKAEIPMDKVTRMREHILCTVIDHGVALCKQVVIQRRVHDKIILKVRLKLLVIRIHDPVLYTNPRILRSLHFLFGASLVDVAELKAVVTIPSLL